MDLAITGRAGAPALPAGSADRVLGYALGAAGVVAAALLYRTYGITVPGTAWEITRQLGAPHLLAELAVFLWARGRGYDPARLFRALPGPERAALALFLGTFWVSSVFVSRLPAFSASLCLSWVVHLLFGGAVFHLGSARRAEPARVAEGFAAGLAVLAAMTAWHFLTPPAGLKVPFGAVGWGGAVPGFVSHRLFGAWCAVAASLFAGVLWRRAPGERGAAWLLPALFLAATLLVWTGTRAAAVGGVAALAAAAAVDRRPQNRLFWPTLLLVVAVAVPLGAALDPYGDPTFRMIHSVGADGPATATIDGVSSGRLFFWKEALQVARGHPLLGTGAGSSWWLVPLPGHFFHVQPHNALVQFLLNWGLVPTLPLLFLLARATLAAHRACRRDRGRLPFLMALDCLLAMSMLDGMFHFAQFLALIAAFGALCLAGEDASVGRRVDASGCGTA